MTAVPALCFLPFAFCLGSSFEAQVAQRRTRQATAAEAVVQLLAVGPGTGDKNRECSATGFFINAAGYILTNAHVVDEARHCLAGSVEGKIVAKFESTGPQAEAISCEVVAMDETHDLAILKLDRPRADRGRQDSAALDTNDTSTGTAVAVTGHSASSWQRTTQKGKVIGHVTLALDESRTEKTKVLILNIPLQRGASGSPVYLESGAVIGVVSRQNPSRPAETVAVPISHAVDLLNPLGVRWTSRRALAAASLPTSQTQSRAQLETWTMALRTPSR
jgi:S1-C subfamily serine protease